ncbi:GNAT family N-acetyltransferase [Saccharopolyspora erythraea]|uniref:GNAT family N-acetyltransferase n=1 Tax=Saccharopolyspora erythraea TaxID=1836 RepID=UPI0020137522|nr:GNAT family N-acetyltransferase [Saccharopolyspora erythraea]
MIVRSWRPGDARAVHRICVQTGDAGDPVHPILDDPDLVAYVFADPYLLLQPELAFVAESGGTVLGYVVAALHTEEFYARWQFEWAPRFAATHPASRRVDAGSADSQLRAFLHRPRLMVPPHLDRYPSHLHINLLPGARRRGAGKQLMHALFRQLARAGSPGVQLGVRVDNTRAQAFYRATGMSRLASDDRAEVRFGLPLNG